MESLWFWTKIGWFWILSSVFPMYLTLPTFWSWRFDFLDFWFFDIFGPRVLLALSTFFFWTRFCRSGQLLLNLFHQPNVTKGFDTPVLILTDSPLAMSLSDILSQSVHFIRGVIPTPYWPPIRSWDIFEYRIFCDIVIWTWIIKVKIWYLGKIWYLEVFR